MKLLILFFVFLIPLQSKNFIHFYYTLVRTPFIGQTVYTNYNYDLEVNYSSGQNVLITFEPNKHIYYYGDNINIYYKNSTLTNEFNYIIQRDGINCALFVYDIQKNIHSLSFIFENIESNFSFNIVLRENITIDNTTKDNNDFVMLAGTSLYNLIERQYIEIICYSKKSLLNKKNFYLEVNETVFTTSKSIKTTQIKKYLNIYNPSKNYVRIKIQTSDIMDKNIHHIYSCKNYGNDKVEIIETTYYTKSNNNLNNHLSNVESDNKSLIIPGIIIFLFLIYNRFIQPSYKPFKKNFKENLKKREENVCDKLEDFCLKYINSRNCIKLFNWYNNTNQEEFINSKLSNKLEFRTDYTMINLCHEKSCIYIINNLSLDASIEFWKFAYCKKIELIVTLASCFNYTNAEVYNDHFYEYAPGYFPEKLSDMTITMNEKEKTNITGIYLKDFEIKKTSLSETNCSSETSILQLYVANWKLNNCFLSPFYISNILCLIDSLNCETLLIHGTLIGKRAYILSAIIFLYDNLKNKIETCQELTENTINDALMEFNTITKTKKFTKFEYEIIIISLFAHFIKKGNIQSNELEQKLKNQFKEIYEY